METLKIPKLAENIELNKRTIVDKIENIGAKIEIDKLNWIEYPHFVDVHLFAAHNGNYLFLYYKVKNDFMRSQATTDQEAVWEDACVEFFMKSGNNYYNFEFNSLGVCVARIGAERTNRKRLEQPYLEQIIRFAPFAQTTAPTEGEKCDWDLLVAIPLALIQIEVGNKFSGNFYKCGDKTVVPHFLSHAPIVSETPNFHLPQYFREMVLVW